MHFTAFRVFNPIVVLHLHIQFHIGICFSVAQEANRLDMCSNVQTNVTKKKNEQPAHCNMIRGKKPVPKEFFLMQQYQSGS